MPAKPSALPPRALFCRQASRQVAGYKTPARSRSFCRSAATPRLGGFRAFSAAALAFVAAATACSAICTSWHQTHQRVVCLRPATSKAIGLINGLVWSVSQGLRHSSKSGRPAPRASVPNRCLRRPPELFCTLTRAAPRHSNRLCWRSAGGSDPSSASRKAHTHRPSPGQAALAARPSLSCPCLLNSRRFACRRARRSRLAIHEAFGPKVDWRQGSRPH